MKFSVVTISFNQARYLEEAILSVLAQQGVDIEYIIVDPGSTDGSREIIERYRDRFAHVIFERDDGPADGLNRGFALATGDILCYLNSDDTFLPDAFSVAAREMANSPELDVLCGHAHVIDEESGLLRLVYSDAFSLERVAYGAAISIQPSTFFRREVYRRCGGFNIGNRSNWDGELLIDMALAGARFGLLDQFCSCYRVHRESITGTARMRDAQMAYARKMFRKIKNRDFSRFDNWLSRLYKLRKHLLNPKASYQRLRHGPVFGAYEAS